MKNSKRNLLYSGITAASALALLPLTASADLADMVSAGAFATELEARAALSIQAAYDQLLASGCSDFQTTTTEACSGGRLAVWRNVRELVHTANALGGGQPGGGDPGEGDGDVAARIGPSDFSLGLDARNLGFALRWSAGEEFAAQESLSNDFAKGQISSLASRISALRKGASGFFVSGLPAGGQSIASHTPGQLLGGGASADGTPAWSPWGGFLNVSHTRGDQGASQLEDAFDFDGHEVSAGIDYRLDDNWVVGVTIGIQDQNIDFDRTRSVVEGGVEMTGHSFIPFVSFQSDQLYLSLWAGIQAAEFETEREVHIESRTAVAAHDTALNSKTDSRVTLASIASGYTFRPLSELTLEPYITVNYQNTEIDGFSERDVGDQAFDFVVDDQRFESLEKVLGFKAQYTLSNAWGVFVPYVDIQSYTQEKTEARFIRANYVQANDTLTNSAVFLLPTDGVDSDYKVYSAGLYAVIRGASQSRFDEAASGGIQVYVNASTLKDFGNFSQDTFSVGIRYEF